MPMNWTPWGAVSAASRASADASARHGGHQEPQARPRILRSPFAGRLLCSFAFGLAAMAPWRESWPRGSTPSYEAKGAKRTSTSRTERMLLRALVVTLAPRQPLARRTKPLATVVQHDGRCTLTVAGGAAASPSVVDAAPVLKVTRHDQALPIVSRRTSTGICRPRVKGRRSRSAGTLGSASPAPGGAAFLEEAACPSRSE